MPERDDIVCICAGLLYCDGRILLGKRTAGRASYPSVWDLPGGHSEPGESPDETLERELQEEIGVMPIRPRFLEEYQIGGTPDIARLVVYLVSEWQGEPENLNSKPTASAPRLAPQFR